MFDISEHRVKPVVRNMRGDLLSRVSHNANMAKAAKTKDFKHTWFFREWMDTLGRKQADLIRDLGWSRAKASDVWNGQQYTQALIDELAPYLHLRPYEMLMPPEDVFALRAMRDGAARLAHVQPEAETATAETPLKRRA